MNCGLGGETLSSSGLPEAEEAPTMDAKRREPTTERQEVQVDACPEAAGVILSVGPVSIWLEIETAKQVAMALRNAISPLTALAARKTGHSN